MTCDRRDLPGHPAGKVWLAPVWGRGIRVVGGEQHLGHIVGRIGFVVISVLVEVDSDPRLGKRSEQVLVAAGRDQQPWPAARRGRAVQRRDDLLDDRGRVSCFIEGIDHHREGRPREERVREFCARSDAETCCELGE